MQIARRQFLSATVSALVMSGLPGIGRAQMKLKPGDADALAGDLVTKTANVEVETGGGVKSYAIQLRKYDVAPKGQGTKVMSRWLIQSITPQ